MARKATGNTDQGISAAVQNPTRYTISVWFRPTNAPSISTYSNVVGYGDSTCEGGSPGITRTALSEAGPGTTRT
jgi:hypothetical protein